MRVFSRNGAATPSGIAIFSLRQGDVLVSEAAVPASRPLTSGRIYAEVGGPVNTGLAISNPGNQEATITFSGVGQGSFTLSANRQIASFLNEPPFNIGSSAQGALTLTSNVPVSLIALRGFTNERREFLTTTLPVIDLSATPSTGTAYIAHFADGGGFATQIVLVNPTGSVLAGAVQFMGQGSEDAPAEPVSLVVNGQTGSSFNYSIPAGAAFKLATAGEAGTIRAGSVRSNAQIQATSPLHRWPFFRTRRPELPSRKRGYLDCKCQQLPDVRGSERRQRAGGTNPDRCCDSKPVHPIPQLQCSNLPRLDGTPAGAVTTTLPGNGQVSKFVHELFPNLALPFQGILRISGGTASGMSVVGVRGRSPTTRGAIFL